MARKKITKKNTGGKLSQKKTVRTTSTSKSMVVSETRNSKSKKTLFSKRNIIVVIGILIVGIIIYLLRGLFIAATVNGEPITRLEIIQQLEKQNGKQILDSLVTKKLILREMKNKNITVSDEEINSEIKKIENALSKQGRNLNDALAQQKLSKDDFIEQLRIQKMVEKLFSKDVVVKDEEVDKYIEQNKEVLPTDQDENTLKSTVKEQLKQEKLGTKFQAWLQELQKKAKIDYYVNY